MTGTLTYTGVAGPGRTLTSAVFSDVTDLDYQFANGTLKVTYGTPSKIVYLDLTGTVTITMTISGTAVTATVST